MSMWKPLGVFVIVAVAGSVAMTRPSVRRVEGAPALPVNGLDLSSYDDSAPARPIDVAFVHHSVGAQLLAVPGPVHGRQGDYRTDPNGGGLAPLLAANNYRLHEATYGSTLGEHTDLFDWLPKFRGDMPEILTLKHQNERLPVGGRNQVVIFKSCFPNNQFSGDGTAPGNPVGPELTDANARATMLAVREELARHPDVLFVYLTAPAVALPSWLEPSWKRLGKQLLGRPTAEDEAGRSAEIARRFNNWVKDPASGWLAGYGRRNIVVFDFYDILTDGGASNFTRYASGDGSDSHPSRAGNAKAATALIPFLNRAVRYAGITAAE
jgi:hypothetical protein